MKNLLRTAVLAAEGSSDDDIDPEDMNTWYDEDGNLKPGVGK